MKRRDFITKAGLGTAAVAGKAGLVGCQDQAEVKALSRSTGKRKVLTCVSSWPRDFFQVTRVSAQRLMDRITQLSEGRITMEYFASGEKVGGLDVFDEVASATHLVISPLITISLESTQALLIGHLFLSA